MKRHLSMRLLRILTFGSGPAILFFFYCVLFLLKGSTPDDLSEEALVILFQLLWISIPFIVLGLHGQTRYLPWLVAILLYAVFLIYILVDAKISVQEGTGVNIGAGLFFLVLPFIVTFICLSFKKTRPLYDNEH